MDETPEQESMTPEEIEQQRQFDEAVDPNTGDFRSRGHRMKYYGEEFPDPSLGVNPYDYPEDQTDRYQEDLALARQRVAVRDGVREGLAPRPVDMGADDEFREQRVVAIDWIQSCQKKAQECLDMHDYEGHRTWKQREKWGKDDLQSFEGRTKAEEIWEDIKEHQSASAISKLLHPCNEDSDVWNHPRMQHDAAVELIRFNNINRKNLIVLPMEEAPYGNPVTLKPSHMVGWELPPDIVGSIRQVMKDGKDFNEKVRKAYGVLRKSGHITHGEFAVKRPAPKVEEEKVSPHSDEYWQRMSQKDFEEMREKQGAKRF